MGQVWKKGRGGEGEGEEKYKGSRMQDFKANTIPHSNLPRLFNHTPFCYRRPPFKNSDHEACAFKAKIQSTNFAIAQIQWTWLSTKGRVKKVVSILRMKFSIFDFKRMRSSYFWKMGNFSNKEILAHFIQFYPFLSYVVFVTRSRCFSYCGTNLKY